MKKAMLLSMITVVSLLTVISGAKAQKGMYVGAQGAGLVNVMFNETDVDKPGADYKSKLGTSFGVSGGYNFTDHFGVGAEVNYATLKQRYTDNTVQYTQKFNYIKVPVLFTYNTNPDRKFIFTAKAGPQLGFLVNSKVSGASDPKLNGNTRDQYKKVTFGAMAGAGVRVRMTDKMFLDAGLRIDGSFSNTENNHHVSSYTGRSKSHDVSAGVEVGMKYFF